MKILIIDDEQLALDSVVNAVKTAAPDASIDAFRNPTKLLESLDDDGKALSYDVAFLDIKMRGINGIDLAKTLKLKNPKLNFIFVTGYSEYTLDAFRLHASGYLLKPTSPEDVARELNDLRLPIAPDDSSKLFVQTFGNFEVFCHGTPVEFLRSKSKEIFAFLIDKQGTRVTTGEIADVIWEDGIFDRSRQKQLQNYICDMQKSLALVDAEDVVIKNRKGIMVDKGKIDCDLYRFFDGDPKALNSYTGKYMYSYSWAEITAAFLERKLK